MKFMILEIETQLDLPLFPGYVCQILTDSAGTVEVRAGETEAVIVRLERVVFTLDRYCRLRGFKRIDGKGSDTFAKVNLVLQPK